VSADGNPFRTAWWYYRSRAASGPAGNASWADYFDLGYCATRSTLGQLVPVYGQIVLYGGLQDLEPAEIYNAQTAFTQLHGQGVRPRTAHMITCSLRPVFASSGNGGGNSINLWRIDDPLGSALRSLLSIGVNLYAAPPGPRDPSG